MFTNNNNMGQVVFQGQSLWGMTGGSDEFCLGLGRPKREGDV